MSSPPDVDARRLVHACFDSLDAAQALLDAVPHLLTARDGLGETALHYLAVENQMACYLRASHTPSTASPMPASASPVSVSPNIAHAISAVVGGVR